MLSTTPAQAFKKNYRTVVILPIGSCEQHGPHLPIDTDLRIAQLLAEQLHQNVGNDQSILLPAIPFSCSWEHKGIGTIAINVSTLATYIKDIAFSLKQWDTPMLLTLVNWHGGNDLMGALASEISATIGLPTAVIPAISQVGKAWDESDITTAKEIHAGAIETSIIKAFWPRLITGTIKDEDHCEPQIKPAKAQAIMQAVGIRAVTTSGIWGAPERGDAKKGKLLINKLAVEMKCQVMKLLEIVNNQEDN